MSTHEPDGPGRPVGPAEYRLAPQLVARLVGPALIVLALVVFAATLLVALLGLPADILVAVLVLGLGAVAVTAGWLRSRAYVVRLDAVGYRVGVVRGAGVKEAAWADVVEVAATESHGHPCLQLSLRDGSTTTIPVEAVAVDRAELAEDVRARLAASRRR